MQPDQGEHPLTAGVAEIRTRHLGPYKRFLAGEVSLAEAAQCAAELDDRDDVTTTHADAATRPSGSAE